MESVYQKISENIKKYRKLNSWSQEELAEKAEVSRNYISLVETNKEKIGMGAFIKVKKALDVSASELFEDTKEEKEKRNVKSTRKI